MYQDLTKGRETEVDYINGYIAKLGRQNDCPCRTHEFLTRGVHLAEMAVALHNPHKVIICSRCVWIEKGQQRMDGPTAEVLEAYENQFK